MSTTPSLAHGRKLTLDDIADSRAYGRERDAFRQHVIELKQRRRVAVGTIVTFVFENRDTVRFQVQEMARVEKISTDEGIQAELDIYNPLVPGPGELCATMFIELTSPESLREWLPKLVGVERSVVLTTAEGRAVRPVLEAQHEARLTREDTTSCVHYLQWHFTADEVAAAASGLTLSIEHPAYAESAELSASTLAELLGDLRA
jgi:Protein of unknown function (DUF3501)